ncbi:MAG: hypothetical protein IPK72_12405 [Candidatus Eisenbacteria bacterium]|nr:hypothetical protein [Candidatus Eisenbacteria bacterium]
MPCRSPFRSGPTAPRFRIAGRSGTALLALLSCLLVSLLSPDHARSGIPAGIEVREPLHLPSRVAPERLALDGLGRLFVLERSGTRLLRLEPDSTWRAFGVGDQGGSRLAHLGSLFGKRGSDLFALDGRGGVLYRFDLDGHWETALSYRGAPGDASSEAVDFALSASGELLVVDRAGGRLLLFDRFGGFQAEVTAAGGGDRPLGPTRLALDDEGTAYLLDPAARTVRRYSRQGVALDAWRYDEGLMRGAGQAACVDLLPNRTVALAAGDASWLRLFSPDGVLLFHAEFPAWRGTRITDLVAFDDSLLYIARPDQGEVARLAVHHADPTDPARP